MRSACASGPGPVSIAKAIASRRRDWRPDPDRLYSPWQALGGAEATMAEAAINASDGLWQTIRGEAQRAAAADPVFGKAVASAVLAHDDFAAALADLIGQRLGSGATERARFTSFSRE